MQHGTDEETKYSTERDSVINQLFLEKILELPEKMTTTVICNSFSMAVGLCHHPTCPVTFSSSPTERLQQVLATRKGSLGPYLAAMDRSAAPVKPHRLIFASAASANHYGELQALLHNVGCHVFPRLDNFTFVLYDLGLTPKQRKKTEKLCNCTILEFPFAFLPAFFTKLTCYTWKPLIINALLKKSELTVWMDTSVRWTPGAAMDNVFQLLEKTGVLLGINPEGPIALRTRDRMFQFYGDRACQYHAFPEMTAGYILLRNEPFIRQALMEPWVACAFSRECMCFPGHESWRKCTHGLPRQEGACHRFDQSSLSIILTKLYLERSHELWIPDGVVGVGWDHTLDWFEEEVLVCP